MTQASRSRFGLVVVVGAEPLVEEADGLAGVNVCGGGALLMKVKRVDNCIAVARGDQ